PTTAIGFSLLAVGNVTLKVFDVLGQEVATLLNNEQLEAGEHEIQFDGSALTSGVYFYRLSVDGKFSETKKFVLMK
ncbi:MAG: T9SS type A sorting domain-containing protein, partial [Bacteroidota bacterium]